MYRKILCYIDSLQRGGAERVMSNLCNAFVEIGKEVIVVNDSRPVDDQTEYYVDSRVKRFFLTEQNLARKKSQLNRIMKLRTIYKKEKPDIIISFLGPCNLRAIIANFGLKNKLLVSVRNDPNREYGSGIKKLISNFLFLFADGHVFQTKDAAAYFWSFVQKKSKILFNPVNEKFYNIKWNAANKEIAVVGRLQKQKNPLLAIEAFYLISSQFPDYKLVFYGDDEMKDEINAKSKEYNLTDRILVYGKSPIIEKKLANSALYLLTSDYEGVPNALLEAMAVGVPVIATDCPCGGPKMVTLYGSVGMLVKCGDPSCIAEAIKKLLLDVDLQLSMSKAERLRALEFREKNVIEAWDNYINELVDG